MNKKFLFFLGILSLLTVMGIWLVVFGKGGDILQNSLQSMASVFSPTTVSSTQQTAPSRTNHGIQTLVSTTLQENQVLEHAWVKRTVDGDTLDVLINGREEKVRLIGINSPESVDPRRPVECFGKEASRQMDELATGHNVTMKGDPQDQNRDKYGRLLRYIYLEDGTFVNAWMVEHGDAFAYLNFPFGYSKDFTVLEAQARSQQLGLWNSGVCPYYSNK